MGELDGRVAVVTAAAGAGIGKAVARAFLDEGASVSISDVHERRLGDAAEELRELGKVVHHVVDVREEDQVRSWVRETKEQFGRVDIAFNNAGINKLMPLQDVDRDTWDLVVGVNLTGTFHLMREVTPIMIDQGSGVIINMSSSAGWIGSGMGEAAYCASKAGVMGLTRAAAAELGKHGIRVCAFAPGVIYNEFLSRIYPDEAFERMKEGIPLGRLGEPKDVADLAVFVASDRGSYLTGEVTGITGGMYMHP